MLRQGKVALAADDQVVVDREVDGLGGLDQGPGQFPVRGRGFQIAGGVVVDQNQGGGFMF